MTEGPGSTFSALIIHIHHAQDNAQDSKTVVCGIYNLSWSHSISVETCRRLQHEFSDKMICVLYLLVFSLRSAFWVTWVCFFLMFVIQRRLIYSLCIFLQLWCAENCCLPATRSQFRLAHVFLCQWHFLLTFIFISTNSAAFISLFRLKR